MTDDKLAKVIAEIEKYQKQIQVGAVDNRISKEKAEAYKVCVKLRSFVENTIDAKDVGLDFEQELYKYFGQVKDFTLGMRIAKRFYGIGRNYQETVSEEQVKESLISKHEDKTCKENGNSLTQESVSEYLEKVANQSGYAAYPVDMAEEFGGVIRDNNRYQRSSYIKGFIAGAQWQKQQMEAYRIEHCKSLTNEQAELEDNFVSSHVEKNNRIPTFIDAIEYGIEYGKQQLMKNAIDTIVKVDAGGYPYVDRTIELYDYDREIPLAKKGDKVKLIVIKEE